MATAILEDGANTDALYFRALETPPPPPAIPTRGSSAAASCRTFGAMNQAYAGSLTRETLSNLARHDEVPQWGLEACCLRLETDDADAFLMAFETACALLARADHAALVTEFIRELASELGELWLKSLESNLLEYAAHSLGERAAH